jgi:hypothetical protein
MTQPQFEGAEASPAVQMLCKLFVEKVNREQQELVIAAVNTEPHRAKEGYKLNIEQGVWVREIQPPPATVKTELPELKVLNSGEVSE